MNHSLCVLVLCALVLPVFSGAQGITAFDQHQAYLDLTTSFRLLCVAAHPDDEDGAVLAYYRKARGVATGICFVTDGEGGQNAVGAELGEELRVVRMEEAQAAADVLGSKAFFPHLPDFGFTRSLTETLEKWGEEKARERLVRMIRIFRPHVVIYKSSVSPRSHGHHQAAFKVLKEAVGEASDRTKYDDHLQDRLYPWRVRRLFLRCNKEEATVAIDVGVRDPLLGVTYAEIGEKALACHRSQGYIERKPEELPGTVHYLQVHPPRPEEDKNSEEKERENLPDDFFMGLVAYDQEELELKNDADYQRVHEVDMKICKAGASVLDMGPNDPRAGTVLLEALKAITALSANPFTDRKLGPTEYFQEIGYAEFFRNRVSAICQALRQHFNIGVLVNQENGIRAPDERFDVAVTVSTDSDHTFDRVSLRLEESISFVKTYVEQKNRTLAGDKPVHAYFKVKVKNDAWPTLPKAQHYLQVEQLLPGMRCIFSGYLDGNHIAFHVGIDMPEVVSPVQCIPRPARILRRLGSAKAGEIPIAIEFRTQGDLSILGGRPGSNETRPLRFRLRAAAPEGIRVDPESVVIENWAGGKSSYHRFKMHCDKPVTGAEILFHVQLLKESSKDETRGPVFTSRIPVDIFDCKVDPDSRVGVIAGNDQALVTGLKALGLPVQILDRNLEEALPFLGTKDLTTLFIGWRALEALPLLSKYSEQLMEFVKNGGTLVYFGQRPNVWNVDRGNPSMVPFPITLGRDRVCDENATARILDAEHALFSRPNIFGPGDLKGWIQERGLQFPYEVDRRYHRLLSIDSGEKKTLDTGLLVAEYGKGMVVYSALALSRQLKAAVPGVYDLLANMACLRART